MYTIPDENYTLNDLDKTVGDLGYLKIVQAPGITLEIDGVECYGIHGYIFSYKNQYIPTGNAIFVDKNHDISWYFARSDFKDAGEPAESLIISTEHKYGYEWGLPDGADKPTGATAAGIGKGLENSNTIMGMNMLAVNEGWNVLWDKLREFRQTHSDNWFIPSKEEADLIYQAKDNLNNLTESVVYRYYYTSTEYPELYEDTYTVDVIEFETGQHDISFRGLRFRRARLCVVY